MINISSDRKMEPFSDGFETDNSPNLVRNMPIGSTEHHTLYPSGDIDIVAFNVTYGQSYIIETLNLSNGADTYIQILDSTGTPVTERNNDNISGIVYSQYCIVCPPNDNTTLSSRVQISATTTETIYARISRSPSAPNSAAVYGSYDLRITSP